MITRCPECGAVWQASQTCQDVFHRLLVQEAEFAGKTYAVHHLLVLCYHLQHPHLYSARGLDEAKQLLAQFVEQGATPAEVRRRYSATVDSGKRGWKITGTPTDHGTYTPPIQWPMTIVDVPPAGLDGYIDQVRAWARSMYQTLEASGNET